MEKYQDEWIEENYQLDQRGQFALFALENQIMQAIRDRQKPETD